MPLVFICPLTGITLPNRDFFFKPHGMEAGMRQSRPKCEIFGQARRPAPTKAFRDDTLRWPVFTKFDFDVALHRGSIRKKR